MLNYIAIHGRIASDIELRTTESGISVCNFSVAVDRSFSKSGEEKQTDFFSVVAWRGLAEFVLSILQKEKRSFCPESCKAESGQIAPEIIGFLLKQWQAPLTFVEAREAVKIRQIKKQRQLHTDQNPLSQKEAQTMIFHFEGEQNE